MIGYYASVYAPLPSSSPPQPFSSMSLLSHSAKEVKSSKDVAPGSDRNCVHNPKKSLCNESVQTVNSQSLQSFLFSLIHYLVNSKINYNTLN